MMPDNFKISGTGEAHYHVIDLLRVQLKNDNAQRFDTKWDEVHISMASYLRDTVQKGEAASYSRLKQMVRRYEAEGKGQ